MSGNGQSASDPPSKKQPSAEFVATSKALIAKLLQLQTPRLDAKIVSVLLLDGMIDLLMEHITRLKEDPGNRRMEDQRLPLLIQWAQQDRDRDDIEATKRSYHAMEILCGTSANHIWVQDTKFHEIVTQLFNVLLPCSEGNLHHFNKILLHFLRRHPCDTLDLIFLQQDASLFFDRLLPFMTHSPIMDVILGLLFVNDINDGTKEKREACHRRLRELGLISWLLQAIDHAPEDYALTAADFLLRIVDECGKINNGHFLLASFLYPDQGGRELVAALLHLVVGRKPSSQRQYMIKILHSLVKSGTLVSRSTLAAQSVQGPLYDVSLTCQEMLAAQLPELCSVITHDHAHVNSKQLPLTVSDLDLLDTIYMVIDKADASSVDQIPTVFWRIVVDSFFEKRSSNIYHTLFFRLFCLVINLSHEPLILVLIRRQRLITRLIDVYEDKSLVTDTRGFILLILNYLRLMTDAEPTGVLYRIISNHPRYLAFLPTLRSATLNQVQAKYKWNLSACPRPPIYLGPCPPLRPSQYASYTPTLQLTGGDQEAMSGIDLGSDFAYCMGFDQKEEQSGYDTPRIALSRRTSTYSRSSSDSLTNLNDEMSNHFWWGESLTAEDPDEHKPKNRKNPKAPVDTK